MGLFKKKPQYTEQKVRCVHCGHTHVLRKYFAKEYYLDGMPKLSPEQLLAQYTVCHCGAFIYPTASFNPVTKEMMQSPEYQQALQLPRNECILALSNIVFPNSLLGHLTALHMHYDCEILQRCIVCAQHPNAVMHSFPSKCLPKIHHPKGIFEYGADLCEIDLLRQAGKWSLALEKINRGRNREFPSISSKYEAFYDVEEALVKQRDNRLQ